MNLGTGAEEQASEDGGSHSVVSLVEFAAAPFEGAKEFDFGVSGGVSGRFAALLRSFVMAVVLSFGGGCCVGRAGGTP